MPLHRYAFIVKGPGYDPESHQAHLQSPRFSTQVIGVADLTMALAAVATLVAQGTQLIELCGGFTDAEADEIRRCAGSSVPVGLVSYTEAQAHRLAQLFGG